MMARGGARRIPRMEIPGDTHPGARLELGALRERPWGLRCPARALGAG